MEEDRLNVMNLLPVSDSAAVARAFVARKRAAGRTIEREKTFDELLVAVAHGRASNDVAFEEAAARNRDRWRQALDAMKEDGD